MKMRKVVMVGILMAVMSLVSVFAETWQEYIQRAQTMTYNVQEGILIGHWSTWNNDKWGALLASYFWLEGTYENIYKNAPNLSQYERDIYRGIWQRSITQSDDMKRLIRLAGLSNSRLRAIKNRWEHWERHLKNSGTITFN
jgi:hypothetical protein